MTVPEIRERGKKKHYEWKNIIRAKKEADTKSEKKGGEAEARNEGRGGGKE